MAKLIGSYGDQNDAFQRLESRDRQQGGESLNKFNGAALTAYRMTLLASRALALAPVNSLGGALAKIIMAVEELQQEIDELDSGDSNFRTDTALFQSRLLMEDAVAFIGRTYDVTPEGVSMHHIL